MTALTNKNGNSPGGGRGTHRIKNKATLCKESIAEMGRCLIKNRNESK